MGEKLKTGDFRAVYFKALTLAVTDVVVGGGYRTSGPLAADSIPVA
jgi:hypothetical protein